MKLYFISWLISCFSFSSGTSLSAATQGATNFTTVDFTHETCQLETLSSKEFGTFYPAVKFFNKNGVLELLVRFMGIADGHIALVPSPDTDPRNSSSDAYVISLGSYNNKISEIRRGNQLEFKMNTPGILSDRQYRGFLLRHNPTTGANYVYSEGSELPLLHLVDPHPFKAYYFGFSTWNNRVVQVAFNCQPKDQYSHFTREDQETAGGSDKGKILSSYLGVLERK